MTGDRVLVTAAWVVGYADGGHRLYRNGEVVFQDGEILFVGHGFTGEVARRIDYGFALIAPGFVDLDALADLDTTILSFDNGPEWRAGRVWPVDYFEAGAYEMYTPEELAFQKHYAFCRLIRNGVTTALPIASPFYRAWAETYDEFAAAAEAAERLGLRVYLGPNYRSGTPLVADDGSTVLHFDEPRGLAGLDEAVRFARDFEGRAGGLVRTMFAPDRIEFCTEALLTRTAAVGREFGVPVRLHCAQSRFERDTVRRLHGCTSIEWLARLGFLTDRTLLPHGTFVSPSRSMNEPGRDLDLIVEAGSTVVHCPLVAARFGDGLDSFRSYRAHGVKIGMGTDTAPPDMILNMQVGLLINRFVEKDEAACRAEDFYDAATIGGADALGRPDLGRLAAGCRADLIVVDLESPAIGQVIDPIQTLLIAASGRDVRTVVIDGRFVMEDRIIPGVDERADTARAQVQFDGLVARYPDRTYKHPPVEAIFRPAYPVVDRRAGG